MVSVVSLKWVFAQVLLLSAVRVQGQFEDYDEGYLPECSTDLGMYSKDIPDHAITASSSFENKTVGPQSARIRTEHKGGAWCPASQIKEGVYEYLEIDLGQLHVITRVETQGRFGNAQGKEFAPHYIIEYQRTDNSSWIPFRNKQGVQILEGNSDTFTSEKRELHPPIITRRIRFVPHSTHPRTVCMRVEMYGCVWKDNLISYSMRQGDTRGQEVDFVDHSYDGVVKDNYLSDGLGQLVDFEEGEATFRMDRYNIGKKGYEWIGWKNDSMETAPVEIIFEFQDVMDFSAIELHCSNLFSKDIRVFHTALLYFSVGGEHYVGKPIRYDYYQDIAIEQPRYVTIPIPHEKGKFLKLKLYFADRWMMISEVSFTNTKAIGLFVAEVPSPSILPSTEMPAPLDNSTSKDKDTYMGIIIGAVAAFLLLMAIVVAIVCLRHRRRHKYKYNGSPMKMFIGHDHINFDLIGTNSNSTTAGSKGCNGNLYRGVATEESDSSGHENSWTKLTSGGGNKEEMMLAAQAEGGKVQGRRLPELPLRTTPTTITGNQGEYACTDVSNLYPNLVVTLPPHPVFTGPKEDTPPPPPPPYPHPHAMCAAMGTCPELMNLQGLTGNSVYACPASDLWWKADLTPIQQFPRDKLIFRMKLGEGQFGEVHLCEALGNHESERTVVAVKMLRSDACPEARDDFQKEIKILSRLHDPNIVRVLAVCTEGEPLLALVEYMQYGDLHEFMRTHYPENTLGRDQNQPTLSYGTLIYLATQVASGMKYLEALNMVHRDLAARNCLVGTNYTIKISDFGMSRSLYSQDYYRIEGKAMLPIRWMAWESILLGKFSTKSDVWSFAVTLWEMLTFAREQPHSELSDEQVIDNCGYYYHNTVPGPHPHVPVYLPQPVICPKEIYDLMLQCWSREDSQRPSFYEIHKFLEGKNKGYQSNIIPRPQLYAS